MKDLEILPSRSSSEMTNNDKNWSCGFYFMNFPLEDSYMLVSFSKKKQARERGSLLGCLEWSNLRRMNKFSRIATWWFLHSFQNCVLTLFIWTHFWILIKAKEYYSLHNEYLIYKMFVFFREFRIKVTKAK